MAHEQNHKYLSLRNRSSMIPLQHLRFAVVSAEYGSFRRAAEALLTQQSTLSRCIHQLEGSIGVIVFERSSGGVCATSAGRDNGAVDSRTNGCAGFVSQVQRTRRGWPAVCGILYIAIGGQFTGDVGRFQAAVPTGRT